MVMTFASFPRTNQSFGFFERHSDCFYLVFYMQRLTNRYATWSNCLNRTLNTIIRAVKLNIKPQHMPSLQNYTPIYHFIITVKFAFQLCVDADGFQWKATDYPLCWKLRTKGPRMLNSNAKGHSPNGNMWLIRSENMFTPIRKTISLSHQQNTNASQISAVLQSIYIFFIYTQLVWKEQTYNDGEVNKKTHLRHMRCEYPVDSPL